MIPLNDEDPKLRLGCAEASSSFSSSGSRGSSIESDDEDMLVEVQQTKKAVPKQGVKIRPNPSWVYSFERGVFAASPGEVWDLRGDCAELLAKLGGKAKENMLDLTEIDASLKFIMVLQGKKVPKLKDEVKRLREQQDECCEGWDVFTEFLVDVKEVIGIPNAANDISVAQTGQVSEVTGPSAIETIDVEGVVPEERAGNEGAE
ncbi:hypothetical protein AALP_AA7G152700 [Arabis alpina]|uniref:Uncharacterized protein n=1 Tax=Arabis alpina TaxID=50452 RepID=A0A087GI77_ARAAL|nr:hypothetical protein AALP_AA7G152700 [Arabis alpina]